MLAEGEGYEDVATDVPPVPVTQCEENQDIKGSGRRMSDNAAIFDVSGVNVTAY